MNKSCPYDGYNDRVAPVAATPKRKRIIPTIDWATVSSEVVKAKRDMAKDKRYVKVDTLVDYIKENREKYPGIGECGDIALKTRVGGSFRYLNWPRFTGKMARNQVYADPEVEG